MKIPGMGNMMKQVQKIQEDMQKAKAELANTEIIGEAGGGLVKVILTGHYDCKKVDIENSLFKEDKEMLEDLIAAAINDAVRKIETTKKDKLGGLNSGINISDGFDMLLS